MNKEVNDNLNENTTQEDIEFLTALVIAMDNIIDRNSKSK